MKKNTNGTCKTLMSSQGKEYKSNKKREAKSKPKGNQAMHFRGCIPNQRFFGKPRTNHHNIPNWEFPQ